MLRLKSFCLLQKNRSSTFLLEVEDLLKKGTIKNNIKEQKDVSILSLYLIIQTKIQFWSFWYDAVWVDLFVTTIIMFFYVIKVDCFFNTWFVVEFPCITPKIFIVDDSSNITLEMSVISTIKANQCCK